VKDVMLYISLGNGTLFPATHGLNPLQSARPGTCHPGEQHGLAQGCSQMPLAF